MADEHRLIVFDRRAPLSYFTQLNDLWQHPPHVHALALHEVLSPPPDLTSNADSTFILELSPDCNRRAMPTDVLILLDIVIANLDDTGDPTHLRRVVWSRRMMSRQGILYLASSSAFCDLPEVQCEVQINRQTWSEDDHAQRQVLHGDFVKLSISGPREMSTSDVQVILCEQEAADIQRYIFRRSPSRSSTSQDSDGAASGSVPSGADLSTDTDEQENADTHEPLYQSLQLSGKPSQSVPLVDITNLQSLQQQTPKESICETGPQQTPLTLCPLTEPHVSDRWCALQEGQGVPIEPAELTMSPVKLSLEKLIPNDEKPSYGQVSVSLPGLPDFAERICSFNTYLCSEVPAPHEVTQDHVDLIADWARAIAFAQHNEDNDPIQIAIYTDGSKLWNDAIIEETSGWSYVVTAKWAHSDEWGIIGHNSAAINVDKETSYWLGATAHQSYQAETEALVRALLWLCQSPWIHAGMPCTLISDATSALFALDGSYSVRHRHYSKVVRPLYRFVDSLAPLDLQWQKAHNGQIFNEFADHLARLAAGRTPLVFQDSPIHPDKEQQLLAWLWFCGDARNIYPELPAVDPLGFVLQVPHTMSSKDFADLSAPICDKIHIDLQMMTCNVNSFKDPSKKGQLSWTGRAEMLRQQAIEFGSHCLAWQETRRRYTGVWSSKHFIGIEVASNEGKGGTALWFRQDIPFATMTTENGKTSIYFKLTDLTVLLAHHEILIVKYRGENWKAIFISGHAPNELTGQSEKDAFWMRLDRYLAPFADWPIIAGMDANARIGNEETDGTGTFAGALPNDNGLRFLQFLQQHRLCAPSTFEHFAVQPGTEQGTWLSKGGWKRIDYVLYPQQWLHQAQFAMWTHHVEKDVDKDDHKAACGRCRLVVPAIRTISQSSPHQKLRIDTKALTSREGKQQCREILRDMVTAHPGFAAPADEQANFLHETAHHQLHFKFPLKPRNGKPSWITDQTWETIGQSRAIRRKLQQLRSTWTSGMLREIFDAWRNPSQDRPSCAKWQQQHDVETACALHQLEHVRRKRSFALRSDEARYLENCAQKNFDELNEAKGTQLWKRLRSSLPRYRRRRARQLPMESTHEQFMTHFAGIEDAKIQSVGELRDFSAAHSASAIAKAVQLQVSSMDIPTVFELEDAIRQLQIGRSSIGSLPAEFLRADPAMAATLLYPSLIALFRFFQQPLSWKGGQYFPLFKGKGSFESPDNYRAILIGNAIPKVFHKILRKRLMVTVAPSLLPFQIGGLPRMSVHFAAHFLGALRQRAFSQKRPNAVIFFDLKSAFYRAQRSTIVRDLLNYAEDCLDEDTTLDVLGRSDALTSMQVPITLRAVLQEVFSGTWNTVMTHSTEASNTIMRSVRGTRPGDPIADLAFTCAMRQILRDFVHDAKDTLPPLISSHPTVSVPPITWVDDVAVYLEADTSKALLEQVRATVKMMAAKCRSYGLDINVATGKSEVLFQFHGREATLLRKQLFHDKSLELGEGCWNCVKVPITSRYTHLGVIHSANLSFDNELHYRLARGREALRECKKTILSNVAIPANRRWMLAKSLVMSRVFFACEIWPQLTSAQEAKVKSFVFKVARIILNQQNFAMQPHTIQMMTFWPSFRYPQSKHCSRRPDFGTWREFGNMHHNTSKPYCTTWKAAEMAIGYIGFVRTLHGFRNGAIG